MLILLSLIAPRSGVAGAASCCYRRSAYRQSQRVAVGRCSLPLAMGYQPPSLCLGGPSGVDMARCLILLPVAPQEDRNHNARCGLPGASSPLRTSEFDAKGALVIACVGQFHACGCVFGTNCIGHARTLTLAQERATQPSRAGQT